MCGICGVFQPADAPPISSEILEQMTASLAHRGPDDRGLHIDGPCGLGHARLSIIDLAGGRQPLFNEDRSIAVVCNGEIYNYQSLRDKLIRRGHRFRTNSDCEVLPHLWEDEGAECVQHLRGMFAFVIYDRRNNVLFGARDRLGQKPLFYHWERASFAFASEIKALLALPGVRRKLNVAALDHYLFYQFVPHPQTLFENVQQLPPAHSFLIQDGRLELRRYWQLDYNPDLQLSDDEHLERVEQSLADAVGSHLVSDVPVGVFLSGGIDSSLVAGLAAQVYAGPLQTFSISFPGDRLDESPFARLASRHFGAEHHEFAFEPQFVIERLDSLIEIFDQPIADRSAIPLMLLSEQTARHVKVVLTGDGGDELFAGYRKHQRVGRESGLLRRIDRGVPRLFSSSELARCRSDRWRLRKLRSRLARTYLPERACSYLKHYWEGWERNRLYAPELAGQLEQRFTALDALVPQSEGRLDLVNRMLQIDQAGYLPDNLLLKTDYSTMAYGLEARAPLLDHQLAETAARLPVHLKATAAETKVALRRIAARWLPPELISRPKRGFGVPLQKWFRDELHDWVRGRLLDSAVVDGRCFRRDVVESLLNEHASGRENHTSKIYSLLVFAIWHRRYME